MNLNEYIVSTINNKKHDLMWGIELMFSGAINILVALQELPEDFGVDDVANIVLAEVDEYTGEATTRPAGKNLIALLTEEFEDKQAERAARKDENTVRRLANRAAYVAKSDMVVSLRATDTGCKYRYEQGLDAAGLMEEYLRHLKVQASQPVVMNVLNRLPKVIDNNGRETNAQHKMPESEARLFWDHGYILCNNKTLWNRNIPELWELMHSCLPMAIDFSSYHRRLRAPLIPGGYLPAIRTRTHNIRLNGELMGADGAGLYDPDHEDMIPLVQRYGAVGLQFTAVCKESGKLWKGMLVPRQGLNESLPAELQCGVHFDHLQVKGARKSEHKAFHKLDGEQSVIDTNVHIGFMKAKTKLGSVTSCFETLENIGPDPLQYRDGEEDLQYLQDKADTAATIRQLTEESCAKIGEDGPEGLLGKASRDDQYIRRIAEFLAMANKEGAGINPMDIPILASKVEDSLGKALWTPANGAGFSGKYPISIIDNTLEPGTVVISGYKPGSELACWRFPAILAQSLRVLKVVPGKAHHKVDGKLTPNIIWMNSFDITVCQQGDDDGDEVGISNDPRVIKLFKRRKDNRIFLIEPEGEKFTHPTDSPEGREYIMNEPMGPVGKVTIWKAGLAAVGSKDYEIAFAVLIQEAIDMQKNRVRFTDVHRAANLNNWYQDPATGWYHIHKEGVTNNFMSGEAGTFPLKYVQEAYGEQMIAGGCVKTVTTGDGGTKTVPGYPLGWRIQNTLAEGETGNVEIRLAKRIAVDNWLPSREKEETNQRNWVHHAHDIARECWMKWNQSFKSNEVIPTKEVLLRVLRNLGHELEPLAITWSEYAEDKGLRERSGINKYGLGMQKAMSTNGDMADSGHKARHLAAIDSLKYELNVALSELNAQELLTIWCMELTDCWWYKNSGRTYVTDRALIPSGVVSYKANKTNYAFAAVTSKHSAIMRLLGFTSTEACNWLEDDNRVNKFISWCRKQENPFVALTQIVRGNKLHAHQCHDDTGTPVQLGDCPECTERLKTALVRSIRSDKKQKEYKVVGALVTSMNKQVHEAIEGIVMPEVEEEAPQQNYGQFEQYGDEYM